MTELHLDVLDADGALRETDEIAAGMTRGQVLRRAAAGGGVLLGSSAFMGMLPQVAAAKPSKKQDLAILNFALTLEYLEARFYKEAVDSGALSGDALNFAKLVADHEATHVTVLRKTIKSLGGKPVSQPTFDFQGTNTDQAKFIQTAFVLENTGVRAYLGQAGHLKSKALLGAAASIVTVEARHAAAAAVLVGQSPYAGKSSITPSGAFDRSSPRGTILKEVGATGFIKG